MCLDIERDTRLLQRVKTEKLVFELKSYSSISLTCGEILEGFLGWHEPLQSVHQHVYCKTVKVQIHYPALKATRRPDWARNRVTQGASLLCINILNFTSAISL